MHEEGEGHVRHRTGDRQRLSGRGRFDFADAFGVVEVIGGDHDRSEQHYRAFGFFTLTEIVHGDVQGGTALAAGELFDGSRQASLADAEQGFGQGVEADDGDVVFEAEGLDRFQRAEGHVIVGGDDHIRGFFQPGQAGFGHREGFIPAEVGGLLEDDGILVRHLIEDVVDTLVAVDAGAGAGLTLQVEDAGSIGVVFQHPLRLRFATLDVVRAHVGQNAIDAFDAAVDGHHDHARFNGLLHGGSHRGHIQGADDERIHALDDGCLDVGSLLGNAVLPIHLDEFDVAQRFRFRRNLRLHVHEEGEGHVRHRTGDRQWFVILGAGRYSQGGHDERQQQEH